MVTTTEEMEMAFLPTNHDHTQVSQVTQPASYKSFITKPECEDDDNTLNKLLISNTEEIYWESLQSI